VCHVPKNCSAAGSKRDRVDEPVTKVDEASSEAEDG
jgi:hypothetical protein